MLISSRGGGGGGVLDSTVQCMRARMCASSAVNAPDGCGSLRSDTNVFCRRVYLLAPTRTEGAEERRRLPAEHIFGLLSFRFSMIRQTGRRFYVFSFFSEPKRTIRGFKMSILKRGIARKFVAEGSRIPRIRPRLNVSIITDWRVYRSLCRSVASPLLGPLGSARLLSDL